METTWQSRVADYVQRLESIIEAIEQNLRQCQVDTSQVDVEQVNLSMSELAGLLQQLEESVAEREQLLSDAEAPPQGHTLIDKLRRSGAAAELLDRCTEAAQQIADANNRAVSLFVCQYHLADFGGEIVRLLSGEVAPPTYQPSGSGSETPRATTGGLLDEAG